MIEQLPTVTVYVDGQALFAAAAQLAPAYGIAKGRPNYTQIMIEIGEFATEILGSENVEVVVANAYLVAKSVSGKLQDAIEAAGFELVVHPRRQNGFCDKCGALADHYSHRPTIATDFTVDAIADLAAGLGAPDLVVVVSGSVEFERPLKRVRSFGVRTLAVGFAGRVSDKLGDVRYLSPACIDDRRTRS